jgi:hypothetical protein
VISGDLLSFWGEEEDTPRPEGALTMAQFDVTQVVMTVGSTYGVRTPGATPVVMTVKGTLMSPTPKFQLVEGDAGTELATLTGNFIKTKFRIHGVGGAELGNLLFPAIAFKKTFVLTVGGRGFTADGGLMGGTFRCVDNDGRVGVEIVKTETFRDRFTVTVDESLPKEVGILTAVALHSRFFEFV